MNRASIRKTLLLAAFVFFALFVQPYIVFLIQDKTSFLIINTGETKIKINGFLKNLENRKGQNTYLKADPLGYFPFTKKIAFSTLITISRMSGSANIDSPGRYGLSESWTGMEARNKEVEILIQNFDGEIISISFYGLKKRVEKERASLVKQLTASNYVRASYSEILKPVVKLRFAEIKHTIRSNLLKNKFCGKILMAIENDDIELIKNLLKDRTIYNLENKYGYSLLHLASIFSDNEQMIHLLLEKYEKTNFKSNLGYTPLMLAILFKRPNNICELFLSNEKNINQTNEDGDTALHLACYVGNEDAVIMLIEKGVDLNKKNNDGLTPLQEASYLGYPEIVYELIKGGAKVNEKNNVGYTALHLGAMSNNPKVIKLLLEAGAVADLKDNEGMKPIDKAIYNENYEVIKLLKRSNRQQK